MSHGVVRHTVFLYHIMPPPKILTLKIANKTVTDFDVDLTVILKNNKLIKPQLYRQNNCLKTFPMIIY